MDTQDGKDIKTEVVKSGSDYGKLFRKSVRGFHTQDVIDYLERMTRDRRRDAERYSAHIRSLEEERADKTRGEAAVNAKIAELTQQIIAAQQECTDVKEKYTLAQEELKLKDNEISALKEQVANTLAQPSPAEIPSTAPQDAEIESLNAVINELQESVSGHESVVSGMKEEIGGLWEKIGVLQGERDDYQSQAAQLRLELSTVRTQVTEQMTAPVLGLPGTIEINGVTYTKTQSDTENKLETLYEEMRRNMDRLRTMLDGRK